MGTFFAILIVIVTSLISYIHYGSWELPWDFPTYPIFFGTLFFLVVICELGILTISALSLQKAEQNLTPRILNLFQEDSQIAWIHRGLLFITLSLIALLFYPRPLPVSPFVFALVGFGISFDLLHHLIHRIYTYLNPYKISNIFTNAAEKSIFQNRETDLCDSLDSLSEISLKALTLSSPSLCNQTLDEMREILRVFLNESKSIAVSGQDVQAQARGITDKVSYTLFYFLDRLEIIYKKALESGFTHVCSFIIMLLGKICLYAARCDLSLVSPSIRFIGKFSKEAEEKGFPDISLKGTCTLLEVSKTIVNEIPLTYMDLKDPFLSVIAQLDEMAKTAFRKNKDIPIQILIEPFKDLNNLFQSPKVATHPDTHLVTKEIERVISEWETLDSVMRTFPPKMFEKTAEGNRGISPETELKA